MTWLWVLLGIIYYVVGVTAVCAFYMYEFKELPLGWFIFAILIGWFTGPIFWLVVWAEWRSDNNKIIIIWRKK